MLKEYGYARVGAAVNAVKVADVEYNVKEIERLIDLAIKKGVEILVFPELSICGYTCQDLFLNDLLLNKIETGLKDLKEFSKTRDIVFIVGACIQIKNALYNCAVSFSKGKILGITPKTFIPNYSEFYEYRYFSSALNLKETEIELFGEKIPVSNMLIYREKNYPDICYAVEICEDLWQANAPSNFTSLMGATLIFNLSSSNELVGKYEYRKSLIQTTASRSLVGYIYTSSGINESTTDVIFSGHAMIAEPDGSIIENERYSFSSNLIYQDIDVKRIANNRIKNRSYEQFNPEISFKEVNFELSRKKNTLLKKYVETPFLSHQDSALEEILNIQAYGLAKRVSYLGNCKMVVGISGGLDSTLAFLIMLRTAKILNMPASDVIAITMPGFGTSGRTLENALTLVSLSGATLKEISIKEACLEHYKNIGHREDVYDVVFENTQARERTQILFDYANQVGGIVVGTGDLSEIALGWATFNGDHISNYSVNASIPKTLVKSLISKIMRDSDNEEFKGVLADVLDTPISPELLPLDEKGEIAQKSEESVGPYVLHDFFLYHFIRYGATPKKLYFIACETFSLPREEIKKYLTIFVKRFFSQQFKRNCMPDGIKVGSISLSPRGDLRMSSDISSAMFLKELEECE